MSDSYSLSPIGFVESPYKEKFAIPKQPGLVPQAKGIIHLTGDINVAEAVEGLEQFSHIWVLFLFHENIDKGWKPRVRPPRLGGNQRVGVLATRATHRPNGIGMSAVKLDKVYQTAQGVAIDISGLDLVDGTPVVDIKPYVQYSDAIQDSKSGFIDNHQLDLLKVEFTDQARGQLNVTAQHHPGIESFIRDVLAQDPRPAYKKNKHDDKLYGIRLYDLNIQWQVIDETISVINIESPH